jgi:hypothetical protein
MPEPDEAQEMAPQLWTRLTCSKCRYVSERPGRANDADVENCGLCGAPWRAVSELPLSTGATETLGRHLPVAAES